MNEAKLFWYEEQCELNNPIAVIGFPSIGLVGSIITSFMARELKLKVVAGMAFPDLPQYALIQNGEPFPQVRVYAGPVPKARKKKKAAPVEGETTETPAEETVKEAPKKRIKSRDVIIVTSEVAPKPELAYDFTNMVLDVVKKLGATTVVFVDGIPRTDPSAHLMAAYSNENMKAVLEEADIPLMGDGIVRGIPGVGLFQSRIDGFDTVCIIAPANPQIPDPRAAADTIDPLTKLIPRLNIDPSPLFQEAEDIDERIRAQQTQQSMVNQNLYG